MNLVLNASEAIGDNAGTISIRTGVQQVTGGDVPLHPESPDLEPGTYVFLKVEDTGCGMDHATRTRIFDPFFTTKFTGRGLGLAAVVGIMRGHKGGISVTSEPGAGTCFIALFPAAESAPSPSAATVSAATLELRGNGTILVVDDEEIVRHMARRALQSKGFDVLTAESGPAAISILKQDPARIELVLLDQSMPGMSGAESLAEIRRIRSDLKVIASSGYSEGETMRLFHNQMVHGFLQKPYTVTALLQTIVPLMAPAPPPR
jgi:CheY-like chemotaxis protein